jgi:hypothetical protein
VHVDAQIHSKSRLEPWTPYGAFIYRRRDSEKWLFQEVENVVAGVNTKWPPLAQGLFGASIERLTKAYNHSRPRLTEIASRMW